MVFLMLGGLPLPGGAVWINHHYLRGKWWDSGVSLAGPAANVVLALVLIALNATGVLGDHAILASALMFLAYIELGIVFLNLLPIPGLDGYGVIEPHLPDGLRELLAPLRRWTMMILMLLLVNGAALAFIWDWSYSVTAALGVDPYLLALGDHLANPQLF